MVGVDNFGAQIINNGLETLLGDVELNGDNLVAQTDGLAEKFLIIVDGHQSFVGGITRIEKVKVVDAFRSQVEIPAQNAVIEQQLNVMRLKHHVAMGTGALVFNVEILARLLLHEQAEVGVHKVHAAL